MQRRSFTLAAAAALAAPGLVRAANEAAPSAGPVKIVVGFAPGGGTDVLARVIGQKLGAMWNVSVLVENKPGATGAIAAEPMAWPEPSAAAEIARTQFNLAVASYNAALAQFPALLVAWAVRLRPAAPLH